MKTRITLGLLPAMLFGFALNSFSQLVITDKTNYVTWEQMLLANEINESGEPFAEDLGYNLDLLDPMNLNSPDSIAYTLGIENYEYSRYQLGTIISQSGMGLHMMWAPRIKQMAAMITDPNFDGSNTGGTPNGFKEDDVLMGMIMHFGHGAHQMPPQNAWPQFAEFSGGDPNLPQAIQPNFAMDFSSLHWDRSKMIMELNPAAMGQTMMKQYLWAQDMLSAFHDSDDAGIDADGIITPDSVNGKFDPMNNVYLGGDGADGFIGQVLTAEAVNKTMFMVQQLAYDGSSLGMIDLMNYDPANGIQYFPHTIAVTEGAVGTMLPPELATKTVTDASSHLMDQVSMLWATASFMNMMNPMDTSDAAHFAYKSVFDGDPFPNAMSVTGTAGPFDLMMGTSMAIMMNVMAMHHDSVNMVMVNQSTLNSAGMPVLGNKVDMLSSTYAVVSMALASDEFMGMPPSAMAMMALNDQATFMMSNMQDTDGGFFMNYTIGTGADSSSKSLMATASGIRALYTAFDATGNMAYRTAADNAYNYLINSLYDASEMVFKETPTAVQTTYTPRKVAMISAAMRTASMVGGKTNAPMIYTRFFKVIGGGMQLAEAGATGETGGDSDGDGVPSVLDGDAKMPYIFATTAVYDFTTSIQDLSKSLPNLNLQNVPNPANGVTDIKFNLEDATDVTIEIYGMDGKLIEVLTKQGYAAGGNTVKWNTENLKSGIYMYRLSTSQGAAVKRAVVMK